MTLAAQPAPVRMENSWILRDVRESHLPAQNKSDSGEIILFMRDESWVLFDVLEEFRRCETGPRTLWLYGAPGIGKSTLLYGWSHYVASNFNIPIVWIHSDGPEWYVVQLRGSTARVAHLVTFVAFDVNTLCNLCEGADLVVLDAIREQMTYALIALRQRSAERRLIASTSYRCGGFSSEQSVVVPFTRHVMFSWTLAQYEAARELLLPDVTVDALRELYCYAGGSLRLLLSNNISSVKTFLDDKIEFIDDPGKVLSGLAGQSAPAYINSLMQQLSAESISTPVSEYAKSQLVKKCGLSFVKSAKSVLGENRSFQGWIFELEFITRAKMSRKSEPLKLFLRDPASKSSVEDKLLVVNHVEVYSDS